MATSDRADLVVSLDPALQERVERAAEREGVDVGAWVTGVLRAAADSVHVPTEVHDPDRALRPEDLPDLRGATYRADRGAVRDLLVGRDPGALLQHAGQALLAVGREGLEEVAGVVERGLRERGDRGDEELADLLDGRTAGTTQRQAHLDLEEVSTLLDDDSGGWLDLHTGETWTASLLDGLTDEERPDLDEPDRFVYLDGEGARVRWHDRRDFAERLRPGAVRGRLLDALDGRGAFGRFSRALDDDLVPAWRAFQAERALGRTRAALADVGVVALPPQRDAAGAAC